MKTITRPMMGRRTFMKSLAAAGISVGVAGKARADGGITDGDAAILRFLAAAELLETDAWQQYNELANGNPDYMEALENVDEDMPTYVTQNTNDEFSHADFINAFLAANHKKPVNLDRFRTLPSSQATGAAQIGRLTNLMHLNVDTSWYLRYRSSGNPDFGFNFPQLIIIANRPAIPPMDLPSGSDAIQAIANTAAFHFAAIEQGGSSLYTTLALKVTNETVLRIVISIGGSEVNHFAIWHDKAGNAPAVSIPGPGGVHFPDLEAFDGNEDKQKNLIMPEPCDFIDQHLPDCSVIRPSSVAKGGAVRAFHAFNDSRLFFGQSTAFVAMLSKLAH